MRTVKEKSYDEKLSEIDTKIARLEKNIEGFSPGLLAQYSTYQDLTWREKEQNRREWDAYYEYAANSPAAAIFWEMGRAAKEKDFERVQQLREENRRLVESNSFIKTPYEKNGTIDPYLMENDPSLQAYKKLLYDRHVLIKPEE